MTTINEQHKREIDEVIVIQGGPYSTIELILKTSGVLTSEQKNAVPFILSCLNYVVTQRSVSVDAVNDLVSPYNLLYKNNQFYLPD